MLPQSRDRKPWDKRLMQGGLKTEMEEDYEYK